jgi:hypothetical protein
MVGEEIWSKRFATFEDYNGTKATMNFEQNFGDSSGFYGRF